MTLGALGFGGGSDNAGGATLAVPWTLVTTWGSLFDPDTHLTGFDHTDGTLTYTVTGDTTIYDGFRENGPGVETQIAAISGFADYDPDTWRLFFFDEHVTFPMEVGSDRFGLSLQITDQTLANRATANGLGWGRERVNATVTTAISISATATGAGGTNNIGDHDAGHHVVGFTKASGATYAGQTSKYRTRSTTDWVEGTTFLGSAISATGSSHYLAARVYHRTTTNATTTPVVFVRRVWIAAAIEDYPA